MACCCLSSSLAMCKRLQSKYSKSFISKFIPVRRQALRYCGLRVSLQKLETISRKVNTRSLPCCGVVHEQFRPKSEARGAGGQSGGRRAGRRGRGAERAG